ncbi:MAG: hypothetical protein ACE15F_09000 [bacterium]
MKLGNNHTWKRLGSWKRPVGSFRIFRLGLAVFLAGLPDAAPEELPELLAVQVPSHPEWMSVENAIFPPAARYVDGCQIVRISFPCDKKEIVSLTSGFLSACDPAVSFDGQSILFAGKRRAEETWQIWCLNLAENNLIQLTHSPSDCVSPLYVGTVFHLDDAQPARQIIYASYAPGGIKSAAPSLYSIDVDGQNPKRITFNLGGGFDPDVLLTGRIVFSSWNDSVFDPETPGRMGLLAVSNDGTDLMPFYGGHEPPAIKAMVRVSLRDERVYFIESNGSPWLGGGDIAYVSRRRPLRTHAVLSRADPGFYHSPCPLPEGGLLASYREDREDSLFRLYRISSTSGERLEELAALEDSHLIDTQVLAPHPPVKGRATVVNLKKETGVFYCLNVYQSDRPGARSLVPGSIQRVRVIEGIPAGSGAAGTLFPRRIVGMAPVEADGSFHIEVPAQVPLTFQLLDEQGMARMSQNTWTWVMPNEKRGCIGCHEDRELAPPNRLVQAVVKPAVQLTLPPARRRTVDFQHDIQPLIQAKCSGAACHSPGGAPPVLDIDTLITKRPGGAIVSTAYDTLLAPIPGRTRERYVIPGQARESSLIWRLCGGRPENPAPEAPYSSRITLMPPDQSLTDVERAQFIEWIDLGALWNSRMPPDGEPPQAANARNAVESKP